MESPIYIKLTAGNKNVWVNSKQIFAVAANQKGAELVFYYGNKLQVEESKEQVLSMVAIEQNAVL
jgi:hypothetical protein